MIETLPFQTRARTVDHLGREQIADCPTAISELWKNAYDAYAGKVELHLYDGETPVAAILDNGHGMSRSEFVDKWLVVGTESKAINGPTPARDRKGFDERVRQGQKGIGRLSCANIAPLLLLVSKREMQKFVVSLIDWRLFENPYLILNDIRIPVAEFENPAELLSLVPKLFDQLLTNLWGAPEDPSNDKRVNAEIRAHTERVETAWRAYDALVARSSNEGRSQALTAKKTPLPSQAIENTIITTTFMEEHFMQWDVWKGKSPSGTLLLMADLDYSLKVILKDKVLDDAEEDSKRKFIETLSSFIDPFLNQNRKAAELKDNLIEYAVFAWKGDKPNLVLGSSENFNITNVEGMEHIVEGRFDHEGVFHGRIKSFGTWIEDVVIKPGSNIKVPTASNARLGPIDVFLASMEGEPKNTTHTKDQYTSFRQLLDRYSGLMVHRDGLRVLPYGRTDADYFDIEERRGKHAGREFWRYRWLFGRIGISRAFNPNLKDKAGREGMMDNVAAKTLKSLVVNLLMETARNYFGTASDRRKKVLPKIQAAYKEAKAEEARKQELSRQRTKFRNCLDKYLPAIEKLHGTLGATFDAFKFDSEKTIDTAQGKLDKIKSLLQKYALEDVPANLSEKDKSRYSEFMLFRKDMLELVEQTQIKLNHHLEEISTSKPTEILKKKLEGHRDLLLQHTSRYKKRIHALQTSEFQRVAELISERQNLLDEKSTSLLVELERGDLQLQEALLNAERIREDIEQENAALFEPYIGALESLNESIDLEVLAVFGIEKVSSLTQEIDRLNELAQLGIAIEIIGHELQSYDDLIGSGIRNLPSNLIGTDAYLSIETGYEGLTDQLRFLSPLKLSGNKVQRDVTGNELHQYVLKFFGQSFSKNGIQFSATDAFKSFSVYDQPSRLYPVFINLVNNSRYWVANHAVAEKKIILDVVGDKVVVSDNGPGVSASDLESLFTLFFSKKRHGGRGVGLYLCRANLTAGGHKIEYQADTSDMPLDGANFVVEFRGAKYAR